MKTLFLCILIFSFSIFPQNIKKIKLLLDNNSDFQKAYSLSIDLEHSISDKEGGVILFVDEKEKDSINNIPGIIDTNFTGSGLLQNSAL